MMMRTDCILGIDFPLFEFCMQRESEVLGQARAIDSVSCPVGTPGMPWQWPRVGARLSAPVAGHSADFCSAEKCIDGDHRTRGYCERGASLCHSATQQDPWLEIDLGEDRLVGSVLIYNRIDCCRERLGVYELYLGDEGVHRRTRCGAGLADATSLRVAAGCTGYGRFVTLFLPGEQRTLHIQEFVVLSADLPSVPPSPLPPLPAQWVLDMQRLVPVGARLSEQLMGRQAGWCPAENCIDGDHTHSAHGCQEGSSLCHGAIDVSDPFLEIDLGRPRPVTRVVLYNRADCCQDRLGEFEIWISEAPFTGGGGAFESRCASGHAWPTARFIEVECLGESDARFVVVSLPGERSAFTVNMDLP